MEDIFRETSFDIAKRVTQNYSTSFYYATRLLEREKRKAIFSIYGFVRLADEIVDTFHQHDQLYLLQCFEQSYYDGYKQNMNLNPVLYAFQLTVKKYSISDHHIQSFLSSMKADLYKKDYHTSKEINDYIYGSADVVGLMCLSVFCNGNATLYGELEKSAQKLGSAFQKVNFIRDLKSDMENLDRRYFPNVDKNNFDNNTKNEIIKNIEKDFEEALVGIKQLPKDSQLAVYVAYVYYTALLKKIKKLSPQKILSKRIRISNIEKTILLVQAMLKHKLVGI